MDAQERYKIVPQMVFYDKLCPVWTPFSMFFHQPSYSSMAVNTDEDGFRKTYRENKIIADDNNEVCLFMGGSSAFGIGATSDMDTIPSILNLKGGDVWLNFGARAFASTQQFILLMFHWRKFKKIKKITLFCGINNLVLFYLSGDYSEKWGTFYFWNTFRRAVEKESNISFKRSLLKFFLYPFYGIGVNYDSISKKDLVALLRGEIKPENTFKIPAYSEKINDHDSEKRKLLHVLRRDLENLKIFSDSQGIILNYVLQPSATWIKKKYSEEEEKLFSILDNLESNEHLKIKNALSKSNYVWYLENLKKICLDLEMPFFDMNSALQEKDIDGKWMFVDRIHLTDLGNRMVADILTEKGIC